MSVRRIFLVLALALLVGPLAVWAAHHEKGGGMMKSGKSCGMMHHGKHGGGMGMCPMMVPGTSVKTENVENGIRLTVTSSDPRVVKRLQKRAEIMRLMHELHQEEMQDG